MLSQIVDEKKIENEEEKEEEEEKELEANDIDNDIFNHNAIPNHIDILDFNDDDEENIEPEPVDALELARNIGLVVSDLHERNHVIE